MWLERRLKTKTIVIPLNSCAITGQTPPEASSVSRPTLTTTPPGDRVKPMALLDQSEDLNPKPTQCPRKADYDGRALALVASCQHQWYSGKFLLIFTQSK